MPYLGTEQARRVYDRIGRFQDLQAYERRAVDALVAEGRFDAAHAVLEVGCGTGALARRLLERELPRDAVYLGLDLSPRMAAIARGRLTAFGARARVEVADAAERIPAEDASVDRVVSAYVLDLLPPGRAAAVLAEAARVLVPGGLLCLASLAPGRGLAGRALAVAWEALWRVRPQLVGGCRPSDLPPLLQGDAWRVESARLVTQLAVTSQVVVAVQAG